MELRRFKQIQAFLQFIALLAHRIAKGSEMASQQQIEA